MALVYNKGTAGTEWGGYTPLYQQGKFSMMYDETSDKYWALTNGPDAMPRNKLNLWVSDDLDKWTMALEVLTAVSNRSAWLPSKTSRCMSQSKNHARSCSWAPCWCHAPMCCCAWSLCACACNQAQLQ